MTSLNHRNHSLLFAIVWGFGCAVAVWFAWFITHLPWVSLAAEARLPIVLAVWLGTMVVGGFSDRPRRSWKAGLLAGLMTALLGLLLLGSKLTQRPGDGSGSTEAIPAAPIIALGFLVAGMVIGSVGTAIGNAIQRKPRPDHEPNWLYRFALVTVLCVAPLLFVGGLVTSTDSGMAVPDWPNTFGSNMFLYPLGGAATDIFLEHSHRLFGTLLGLTSLVLAIWIGVKEPRRWVRVLAAAVFIFIVIQGVIGGTRVLADSRWLGVFHGVSAQIIFAGLVAVAVFVSPTYRALTPGDAVLPRKLRIFASAALHTTMLQLVFGAVYRHLRSDHALWSHAGFAIAVLIATLLAGFSARAVPATTPQARVIARCGLWLIIVVAIQFTIGWVTFAFGGRDHDAGSPIQALIRTAHQANGAALLGIVTCTWLFARRLAQGGKTAQQIAGA